MKSEELRSYQWYGGDELRSFSHRARSRQLGLNPEDHLGKPVIAILNTWSGINPCHIHLRELTFVLAFSVFPSAYLVGLPQGETRVLSIAAYEAAFRDIDYPLGSAIAMIMALVMLAVIGLVLAWRSTLYRGSTGGKG